MGGEMLGVFACCELELSRGGINRPVHEFLPPTQSRTAAKIIARIEKERSIEMFNSLRTKETWSGAAASVRQRFWEV
jgi:hypothetical protein